ncbi:MAG: hypothetical protein IT262_03945, partial [Saprospiraceae bacterium]|nr:hypothetical protein [Saprospiraceae bacterium]
GRQKTEAQANARMEQYAEKATTNTPATSVRVEKNKPENTAADPVQISGLTVSPKHTQDAGSIAAAQKQVNTKGLLYQQKSSKTQILEPVQPVLTSHLSAPQTPEIPAEGIPADNQEAIPTTDAPLLTSHLSLLTSNLPLLTSHLSPLTSRFSPLTSRFIPHPSFLIPEKRIVRNKKETRSCYDFAEHPNVLLVDGYFGPSLTRKEMRTGPDNQPYLAQRRNTETKDWSFSAGLRASLLLDRHFLLRSGVHYDQITEQFEYIDPDFVEVTIRQTTQIINGQPVTVIDTLSVDYGEKYLKSFNRFGMLDIPLQAGVELRNGRTGVSINGGIALNVLFWKRGAILSPVDGQPAYFTPGSGTVDVFRTRAGLSAMGSVQWFCHLRPRLRVFAEPYVRMVLRPVNVPSHPVEQRYGMLGLNVGVTRIFD